MDTEAIDAMNINDLKANLAAVMGNVIAKYGDDQEGTGKQEGEATDATN